MNLILLSADDFVEQGTRVRLSGRRFDHIRKVLRATEGDEFCVGMENGRIGAGRIIELAPSSVELDVRFERDPPHKLPLTLLLALPRPKVLRRVIRSAVSLGARTIVLLNCSRVEKSYWQTPLLSSDSLREQTVLGLEQARDTVLPDIQLRPLFKPFVEDELPRMVQGTLPLLAHPGVQEACPTNVTGAITLAIGPEGGFIPYEMEKLAACGFVPVGLGERILSVETAVPALVGRLFS
jgi:16S rRNA (uracil1498-N3)-methyltransferase